MDSALRTLFLQALSIDMRTVHLGNTLTRESGWPIFKAIWRNCR